MAHPASPTTLLPMASRALVGRTRETELLRQALAAVKNGAGRRLALAGEAGIGKTRLLAEARGPTCIVYLCWLPL